MLAKQANRSCEKFNKIYEPATEAEPAYRVSTFSERLCPKCKQQYSLEYVSSALRVNVEKLCMLANKRNG